MPETAVSREPDPNTVFLIKLQQKCLPNATAKLATNSCPKYFDGWACWEETLPNTTAFAACPYYVVGFDPTRKAFKECLPDGTWYRHPETGRQWANYTGCVDVDDLEFRELINSMYIVGYSVSLAALLTSLLIFFTFKTLRCTRIAIHVHLFLSLALNNFAWIIWYKFVVQDLSVVKQNGIYCRCLHVLLQFFMVANYMWMFCEGLHLHMALVVVFVNDVYAMRWFYAIGWGLPAVLTGLYVSWRSYSRDTEQCWMHESHSQWVLAVPVFASILTSLLFLMNVMRVLLTKLHRNSANPAPIGVRKAVRAALILVPLFGIHYILIPYRPTHKTTVEAVYQILSAILVSTQGLCVSVLFCFANVDVHGAFHKYIRRIKRRGTTHTNVTGTTQPAQSQVKDAVV
ncbi:calcitonin gene-related peptide type 1 receptor-like isoform X2 [Sipha flava]|nr:calcitonin gene-related peptide type 1 receptor-like isoform X2 [Sipha flava]XP_025417456.1 calcitonin gene-related peptide type 1 receptor-like isoform X2 [Sipha flava]XP_025417457.1 calcitonin gene-related peptide type 1 receptor-like isoform X2 [Sipha flava]XP_025417459.1 calcitonin gene-related peptide type 1 receptor-like isoform X2 [Sipha flava]XP_025417460.1 calcitonin gene-related peptide type 1 receptor-like isoform X2 [Sipha flava]XP_025417461.1 calcitonin gene-related peptide typ